MQHVPGTLGLAERVHDILPWIILASYFRVYNISEYYALDSTRLQFTGNALNLVFALRPSLNGEPLLAGETILDTSHLMCPLLKNWTVLLNSSLSSHCIIGSKRRQVALSIFLLEISLVRSQWLLGTLSMSCVTTGNHIIRVSFPLASNNICSLPFKPFQQPYQSHSNFCLASGLKTNVTCSRFCFGRISPPRNIFCSSSLLLPSKTPQHSAMWKNNH